MRCGGLARRLTVHRSEQSPLTRTLPRALAWPFQSGGLFTLTAIAAVLWLLRPIGAAVIGWGVAIAWMFQIIRHTGAGHDDIPAPEDFRGIFDDVLGPIARGLFASLWFVAPLIWWLLATHQLHFPLDGAQPIHLNAFAWLLLLAGTLLSPMALVAGALGSPFSTLLNPFAIVGLSIKVGRDYWLTSLFCLACSLLGGVVVDYAELLREHGPPLSGLFASLISLYFPTVYFRALGLFVRTRGDALGWGGAGAYRVPLLDAKPVHELKSAEEQRADGALAPSEPLELDGPSPRRAEPPADAIETPPETHRPELIPFDAERALAMTSFSAFGLGGGSADEDARSEGDGPPGDPAVPAWSEPIAPAAPALAAKRPGETAPLGEARMPDAAQRAEPPRAANPPGGAIALEDGSDPMLPARLAQKMAMRELGEAKRLFREGRARIPPATLSAQAWLDLSRVYSDDAARLPAEKRDLGDLALLACQQGLSVAPEGPLAPRTWLAAARLCDELLGDRARSDELLRELSRRFPDSPEGEFAARRLGEAQGASAPS